MPGLPNLTTIATRPALDRWSAARAEHDSKVWTGDACACKCGWTPPRRTSSPARSVGLHQSAAEKRADKAYDAECKPIIARLVRTPDQLLRERAMLRRVVATAAAQGDAEAADAAQRDLDVAQLVLEARAECGDLEVAHAFAQDELRAARQMAEDGDSPLIRARLHDAVEADTAAWQALARSRPDYVETLPDEPPAVAAPADPGTAWLAVWRCGGSSMERDRADVPAACPEHPDAERLSSPEYVELAPTHLPLGLLHHDPGPDGGTR